MIFHGATLQRFRIFSNCPNLTEIHLAANCITDLTPLRNATSLRFVDLSGNDITSVVPLKDVTFLDGLCLDVNCITDYAEGLCLLARHAGLVCKVVSSETHAFNAVELDGKWYLFDSLWDDIAEGVPTDDSTWNYFGFTTEEAFAMPHHVYDTKRYPVSEQEL